MDVIVQQLSSKITGQTPSCSPVKRDVYVDGLFAELSEAQAARELVAQEVDFLAFLAGALTGGFSGTNDFYPNAVQGAKYTQRLTDLRRFWDVNVPNITVYAVSGKFLADGPLMVKTVSFFYGINATEAQNLVGTVQQVFEEFPVIGYDRYSSLVLERGRGYRPTRS
jgi:hypothetical protein